MAGPICSECGYRMVARRNSRDGSLFWGCSGFPGCRSTKPQTAYRPVYRAQVRRFVKLSEALDGMVR